MKTPLFRLNWREGNGVQNDAKHIHDLVVKMTQLDPHQRISARDCKAHPYCMKHKAVIVSGAPKDMKYQIIPTTKKQDGIAPKIIVMDVPRMQKQICYSGLEQIKNGCFSSPKYKSAMFLMNPPHVVVFANQLPNSTNMSADRFVVITVD